MAEFIGNTYNGIAGILGERTGLFDGGPPGVYGREEGSGFSDRERHERRQNVKGPPGGGDPKMTYTKPSTIHEDVKEPPYIPVPEPITPKIKKTIEKKIEPIKKIVEQKQKDYFFNKKLWENLEKYKTIGEDFSFFPDRGNRQTSFKSKDLLNKFLTNISLEYPDIKMTDEFGYVDNDKVKQVIDQAYFDGKISIGDNINITRTLDSMGEGVTGVNLGTKYLDISGLPEANKYTVGSNLNIGDLGLGFTGNVQDEHFTKKGATFDYGDGTLTGGITKDYDRDYTLSELGLDKTFDLNDLAKLNLQGNISDLRYDGENYIDYSLTPRLDAQIPVGSGNVSANIAKNIIEGGTPDLGLGFSYPFAGGDFKVGASDILSENPNALLSYGYEKGDPYSTDPYLEFKANWDPIEGDKSAFFGLTKRYAGGGIASMLGKPTYANGGRVRMASGGVPNVLKL